MAILANKSGVVTVGVRVHLLPQKLSVHDKILVLSFLCAEVRHCHPPLIIMHASCPRPQCRLRARLGRGGHVQCVAACACRVAATKATHLCSRLMSGESAQILDTMECRGALVVPNERSHLQGIVWVFENPGRGPQQLVSRAAALS